MLSEQCDKEKGLIIGGCRQMLATHTLALPSCNDTMAIQSPISIPAAVSQASLGYSAALANLHVITKYLCRKGLPFRGAPVVSKGFFEFAINGAVSQGIA